MLTSIPLLSSDNYPQWYLSLPNNNDNVYIGYGDGKSMGEARANARSNVASQIKVKINEKYNKSERLVNSTYNKDISRTVNEQIDVELIGLKELKSEKLDGTYYIAVSFDRRSLITKISMSTGIENGLRVMDASSPYLYTEFSKELNVVLNFKNKTPKYEVVWLNGTYVLRINNHEFPLLTEDISKFFFVYEDPTILLDIVQHNENGTRVTTRIHEGDYFHLTAHSKKSGFLTLLNIDEEGKVNVMVENHKLQSGMDYTYPDLDLYEGLQTVILDKSNSAIESYLAVLCRNKMNFTKYDTINEDINDNTHANRFPHLYQDVKQCHYTSLILNTSH